eukprot:TRINITY_DN40422_c0_g1_i1.p1 TRINITY_DN40422_c0_g1~~TRINITY_DN40422_c0_g1_i1.p1  ORF type:complete len:418 (+),score=120.27 TRINITY_DN40422_c0_g1_i1:66-1319(+)
MGKLGVCGGLLRLLKGALTTTGVVLAICSAYAATAFYVASPLDPVPLDIHELPTLPPNNKLRAAEHIGVSSLIGPESMVRASAGGRDELFMSLADGRIVRLWVGEGGKEQWETVVRTGVVLSGCGRGGPGEKESPEHLCGRPLGMRLAKRADVVDDGAPDEEVLVVCDAYKGLLMVDGLRSAAAVTVLARRAPGDSSDFHLLNDLVQAPDGSFYFTETSQKWERRTIGYALFEGRAAGRLLRFQKGVGVTVVATDLVMPNGVTLSHDRQSLLVVANAVQVWKYQLDTGKFTKWSELPGSGDNIRTHDTLPTGEPARCYWGGLGSKYALPFSLLHMVKDMPALRRLIAAALPYAWIVNLIPKYGILAVWDEEGNIIRTYQDPSGRTPWLSEAAELSGNLYVGSWLNGFLAKVDPSQLR